MSDHNASDVKVVAFFCQQRHDLLGACAIKGNINSKGAKIAHAPGSATYDKTVITPSKGERMFCSAAEAIAAGWRMAND